MSSIPQDILQANSSLTLALEAFYHGTASIQVLSELLRPSTQDEQARLELGPTLWERQIRLFIDQTPILYALTRVSHEHLKLFTPPLDQLGTQPLGYWLFQQPSRTREYFRLTTLHNTPLPMASLNPAMAALPPHTLIRESIHRVHGLPISVVELIMV